LLVLPYKIMNKKEERAAREIIKRIIEITQRTNYYTQNIGNAEGYMKKDIGIDIESIKRSVCLKHGIKLLTNPKILLYANNSEYDIIRHFLSIKPVRKESGISIVAVMTSPWPCPHGRCIYCPGGPNSSFGTTPQSYTGLEPAARRGKRNDYDAFLQVMNRLEQYVASGHIPQKIEVIVMGGTFTARPKEYKYRFIRDIYLGANVFGQLFYNKRSKNNKNKTISIDIEKYKSFFEMPGELGNKERVESVKNKLNRLKKRYVSSLFDEEKRNEKADVRIIGLTIETRPDWINRYLIREMLEFGATRVEIGVQSLYENILRKNERGHGISEIIDAFQLLKDSCYKINAHIMIGLYGSSMKKDILTIKKLFEKQEFRPDMLKIYPTLLFKGTKLYDLYKKGEYKPLSVEEASEIISEAYRYIPRYVRVMRIQRDIPSSVIDAGPKMTNLRQLVEKKLREKDIRAVDIRSRQVRSGREKDIFLNIETYKSSNGKEYFIEAIDDNDTIYGFIRLRIPYKPLFTPKKTGMIRELHVYGYETPLNRKGRIQHRGIGRSLLQKAEEIAVKKGMEEMVVISGVGVREYYRKHGYNFKSLYMWKKLL